MAQIQTATRFDFDTVAAIYAAQRKKERQKLRRLRTARRVIHFVGFLAYWSVIVAIAWMLILAAMFLCLRLT